MTAGIMAEAAAATMVASLALESVFIRLTEPTLRSLLLVSFWTFRRQDLEYQGSARGVRPHCCGRTTIVAWPAPTTH